MERLIRESGMSNVRRHRAPLRYATGLFWLCLLAPPSVPAAMVYGNVTNCAGTLEIKQGGDKTVATVPVQKGTYKVVLPSGRYEAICRDSRKRQTFRSDPSPARQDLNFPK